MVYRIALLRTCSAADAEDVVQEVFLRYLRSAPAFAGEEHRKAWFIRVTVNRTKSLLGSAWKRRTVLTDESLPLPQPLSSTPEGEVYQAVLSLPVKYRTAVHLYYYEGYKVSEIARLTGAKETTVKTWLMRARDILRQRLKEEII
ncbi:MAG: sigma-70 family RNA polymerase sigma factor [Ruminococcaceae bacterium]|nr:sigma-70 family RNA polymerase sigma factor [Oscillospiraceae bacterium]